MIEQISHKKENAVLSVGWLFGGNYTIEQTNTMQEIITKFESLSYLERQHIIDILTYIYKNGIDEREVLSDLMTEYDKQE